MFPIFYFDGQPLLLKHSPAQYSNLSPHPAHTDIFAPLPFMWHQKYLLTFLIPFNGSNAMYSIKGFASFNHKEPLCCPFCNTFHQLDPISYITFCSPTSHSSLRNSIVSTWPIPLLQHIQKVFPPFKPSMSTSNIQPKLGDQRNITLISIGTSIIPIKDFDPIAECKNRNKQLTALIPKIITARHNSPLPSIPHPTPYNDSSSILFKEIGTSNPSHLCPQVPEYKPEPTRQTSPILPDAKKYKAASNRTLSYPACLP